MSGSSPERCNMNIAIILSGGTGTRIGTEIPKQYLIVNNKPIIGYCLSTFMTHYKIDGVVIVCAQNWISLIKDCISDFTGTKPVYFADAGTTRQASIYSGLLKVKEKFQWIPENVIIHDAARPLVSADLITDCIDNCDKYDAVMPVIPVKDTIYQSSDGHGINTLLNRQELWCGQAPEAFRFKPYLEIHENATSDQINSINGSTEMAFRFGLSCTMIKGDPMNFKITTPEDLISFTNIVCRNESL